VLFNYVAVMQALTLEFSHKTWQKYYSCITCKRFHFRICNNL